MTAEQYTSFCALRDDYKNMIQTLDAAFPQLRDLQQQIAGSRGDSGGRGARYQIDTPVVYNTALDTFTRDRCIKLLLVGDNPGKREQAAENRAYLVGNSGKLAAGFFARYPELGIDFRRDVLILNKTPVHTARTAELKELLSAGGERLRHLVAQSQRYCARQVFNFWQTFSGGTPAPVWIIGYSEMKKNGIFEVYTRELTSLAREHPRFYASLYFYRHFSMNQFMVDFNKQRTKTESASAALERIGATYRQRILGEGAV